MKTAAQIRTEFLVFFEKRGHKIVPSSPVFPQDDPTLLFTNAGMNQFKDVFLGTGTRAYSRAVDSQKCIRVSGKHNDLEEVGRDTYHHTFFEMLGNWSFGDYFKRDAIKWAWELLTVQWGLPKDRLWVTVFGGDAKDGLPADEESERIWIEECGLSPERVMRFGRKDNFWEMGDVGPCGPCTEIHFDRGPEGTNRADGAIRATGVNAGTERFMEIWNNVFMEFNRKADGSLEKLPAQHVDTGMGFERIVSVLQNKISNYDTDVFAPLFARIGALTGKTYTGRLESETDVAFRVIADHVRALTAAIADGATPGNEGRGYVLRRLLRRAARFGTQVLGMQDPFIFKVVPAVAEALGDAFPEMRSRQDHVMHVIESEEKAFAVTLTKGVVLFEGVASKVEAAKSRTIPGDVAYQLYATYGFPRDLVELMARDRGLLIDEKGWAIAEEAHKNASRGEGGGKWLVDPDMLRGLPETATLYHDAGGSSVGADVVPLKLIDGTRLVCDRTPFYAESGGQVGDVGVIEAVGFRFEVSDTQKMGKIVLHLGKVTAGNPDQLPKLAKATVDAGRRADIMANHTGTHLLHWALKKVLGDHAVQQGSLVAADKLRFDFTHPKSVSLDEIERIETLVNTRIFEDAALGTSLEDLAIAKSRGVTALFGEKYEELVRVVRIGDGYSEELCGGTHCRATGQIGAFAITAESAVAAGVRRIEAVTRGAALRRLQEQRRALRQLAGLLKAPEHDINNRVAMLQEQLKEAKKGGAAAKASDVAGIAKELLASAVEVRGFVAVVTRVAVPIPSLAELADALRHQRTGVCGMLITEDGGKVGLLAFATKDLADEKKFHAGDLIKKIAAIVGGSGGGRPDLAQAGGKDPSRIDEALAAARAAIGT